MDPIWNIVITISVIGIFDPTFDRVHILSNMRSSDHLVVVVIFDPIWDSMITALFIFYLTWDPVIIAVWVFDPIWDQAGRQSVSSNSLDHYHLSSMWWSLDQTLSISYGDFWSCMGFSDHCISYCDFWSHI